MFPSGFFLKELRGGNLSVAENSSFLNQALSLLKTNFGHSQFRGDQEAVLKSVFGHQSALVLMPTGMGKSLCFQLPALMLDGLTVVISPLIALMQDQVDKAQSHGLKAAYISSTLTREERLERYERIGRGDYQLIYVTPERFRKSEFLDVIGKRKISLLAVDEAHCISQWGHDFRPDYSRLGEFREILGNPVTLALTATATAAVQKDILRELKIEDAPTFHSGIERPNLALSVHDVYGLDEKVRGIVGLRHLHPGSAIIYFSLIQTLYKVSSELARMNLRHTIYHGQLPAQERKRNQQKFISGESDFILATPAFGLGVDKRDVRLLVHAETPNSVEAFYQEVGRAGRDGLPSECHLFYDQEDVSIQMEFIKWANPEPDFVLKVYRLIEAGGPGLQDDGADYLRSQMNFYNKRDFRVETSINLLERWGSLKEDRTTKFGYVPVQEPSPEQLDVKAVQSRLKTQNQKLLDMVRLAQLETGCRMQEIYQYFGHPGGPCGKCDLCLKSGLGT
jgi:ATP-dependent DNA helicase RecQ